MTSTSTTASTGDSSYFGASFTAPGLPVIKRTITGHREDGSTHFIVRDNGDHQVIRKGKGMEAAQTVLYSTFGMPVDINKDDDVKAAAQDWQVSTSIYTTSIPFSSLGPFLVALARQKENKFSYLTHPIRAVTT